MRKDALKIFLKENITAKCVSNNIYLITLLFLIVGDIIIELIVMFNPEKYNWFDMSLRRIGRSLMLLVFLGGICSNERLNKKK